MKNIIALCITITLLINCTPPEWKQKGFNSEVEYQKDQEKKKWLTSDSKFIGTWWYKTDIWGSDIKLVYTIEINNDGSGKFEETQGIRFARTDYFNWTKIDNQSIQISGLKGEQDPFKGTYRFESFNGKYTLDYSTNCYKLNSEFTFCN